MRDLFYFRKEKILALVIGYTNESLNVCEFKDALLREANKFAEIAQVAIEHVSSDIINTSRRYKNMRVFWAEGIVNPPKEAFDCKDWTMWKWLED